MIQTTESYETKQKEAEQVKTVSAKLRLEWRPPDEEALRLHTAGVRLPRLKFAYGPRVTGGNPAWEKLGRR